MQLQIWMLYSPCGSILRVLYTLYNILVHFVSILREKTQVYIVALWKNLSSINQRHTIYEGNIHTNFYHVLFFSVLFTSKSSSYFFFLKAGSLYDVWPNYPRFSAYFHDVKNRFSYIEEQYWLVTIRGHPHITSPPFWQFLTPPLPPVIMCHHF